MDQNQQLHKEIRKLLFNEHRQTDCEIDRTTSWPDGLHETSRFLPNLPRPVRRTDSYDDIERYHLYFDIARKNQGSPFTWKYYCNILLSNLKNSDVTNLFSKMSIESSRPPVKLEGTKNSTGLRSVSSMKKFFLRRTPRKRSFLDNEADVESISSADDVRYPSTSRNAAKMEMLSSATPVKSNIANFRTTPETVISIQNSVECQAPKKRSFLDIDADVESICSVDDKKFHSPTKNVLKKMCTEIRTLAQKTCKTVEKITTPAKYCSACGDVIRSATVHKKCSRQRIGQKDCKKPVTPGTPRFGNPVKREPIIFESPTINSAFVNDRRHKKLERKPIFRL